MKRLLVVTAAFGAILLYLLASASANTPFFAHNYPWLLGLNGLVALALLGLVGWQVRELWGEHQAKVFGAGLKLRLMVWFGLMAIVPGVLVYGVSVQFVTKSIESWFDVRVEKALESGLSLGQSALNTLLEELDGKARTHASSLGQLQALSQVEATVRQTELSEGRAVMLVAPSGKVLASRGGSIEELASLIPPVPLLRQVRSGEGLAQVESLGDEGLILRVLHLLPRHADPEQSPYLLQWTQKVPVALAQNAESVQEVYRDYQELSLGRQGLTRIYALTLTLTMLLALFGAFAWAFVVARKLSAPLSILAEGTQAVAQGDFSPRQAVYSRDELGILTQSFSRMIRQLDEARRETDRHRGEVESARAFLERILAHLSAGVLAFDRQFVLRAVNPGGKNILKDNFENLEGEPLDMWPRQAALGRAIRDQFAASPDRDWQMEWEQDPAPDGLPQTLLLRGSRLPENGYVVVFDDITRLIAAQRSAAWGEVARRLAHEIKNPLTPIQLSAERLEHKLADKLGETDRAMLARSTQTIVHQVQAMKQMVDDFRDYARLPLPTLAAVELNELVEDVLGLYETSRARIEIRLGSSLPSVIVDPTQLRQVIHNLLRNAEDATEAQGPEALVQLSTYVSSDGVCLEIHDNGPGFPQEIMARIFEPYVTTKARGTGLGLAIVKKIVDEHHARIAIDNPEDGGGRVRIHLPVVLQKELQAEGETARQEHQGGGAHGADSGC